LFSSFLASCFLVLLFSCRFFPSTETPKVVLEHVVHPQADKVFGICTVFYIFSHLWLVGGFNPSEKY
jgi:hypothetical protein